MASFNDTEITFTCPKCLNKFKQTIASLKGNPRVSCPVCGNLFSTDKVKASLNECEALLAGLRRKVRDVFKKGFRR